MPGWGAGTVTEHKLSTRLLLVCWTLIAAIFMARAYFSAGVQPLILDTDDAMRLTVVHDFLGGQGWYDLVQHRLNTPDGAEIHWSRLIDVPLAALLWFIAPFAGGMADTVLAYIWPLGLLLVLLWVSGKTAVRLGGKDTAMPAMILPAFSLITMAEFAPGRLDHHSVQILLAFAMLYCTMRALERPRFALGAGVAAAVALAIGIEGLPLVITTAMAFGLAWVGNGHHARALRSFGVSFALAAIVMLLIGVPPARWFVPAYDAISIAYAGAAALCGLVFLLLSALPFHQWQGRLAAGAIGGALVGGLVLGLWPGLLRGPYGMLDPWLLANWIDRISEAQPWWVSLMRNPTYPIAVALPSLVGLLVIVWQIVRGNRERRAQWLVYGLFLAVAIAVMLLQIRAARFATPLAMPAGAVLIVAARARYLNRRSIARTLGLIGSWLASAGVMIALPVNLALLPFPDYAASSLDPLRGARQACLMPQRFTELARLEPQRIMAPIDMGSHLLLFTPHAVVAAPYHRNAAGVRDAFDFFNMPIAEAREILKRRDVSLVVICPAMPEVQGMVDYAPDSFVALYAQDRLPDWLVVRDLGLSPLVIYDVKP